MNTRSSRVIVANITWNDSGWRNTYINPRAGHRFVRTSPGHESLNFNFEKREPDTATTVYGFIQWTHPPIRLSDHAIVIFYSRNLDTEKGELVGVYGDATILKEVQTTYYPGFENDEFLSNIRAEKSLSMLFPVRLNADHYTDGKRLVPQVGYAYKDDDFAACIIDDEIRALQKSGRQQGEFEKLATIYQYITGSPYPESESEDEREQEDILEKTRSDHDRTRDLEIVSRYSMSDEKDDPEVEVIYGKRYKRNNVILAKIKYLRGERCQICNTAIIKSDGNPYVEAAHIVAKEQKGSEAPDNILILCPNHHKEFDLGKREIVEHTKTYVAFKLNDVMHTIRLDFK